MFWNVFYQLCEEKNTKPNAVAKVIGVSSATCTKWKNGAIPNGETLLKLADHLGVSVDYLLGRTDETNGYSNNNISKSNLSDTDSELIAEFKKLTFTDKAKVMSLIAELSQKE